MPGFFDSGKYPFTGVKYLFQHPVLFKYLIFALLVDIIITAGLIYFAWTEFASLTALIDNLGDAWYVKILKWLAGTTLFVLLILIFPFVLTLISAIVDPFFRARIYSKTRELEGKVEKEMSFSESLKLSLRSVCTELKKLLFYLFLSVVFLFMNLFFGIGIVFQLIMTAAFVGWEYLGPHLEERKMSFGAQLSFVWKHFRIFLGFGFPAMLLLFIPVLQAFFLSSHTVGGALLSIELEKKD
ncbi:MAG: EI24 domain-containing protein [Spirochaetota bacterium]|nr:EI24 domain-containing protein [Spirochaetota bacterium]